eukprot:IDg22537t1
MDASMRDVQFEDNFTPFAFCMDDNIDIDDGDWENGADEEGVDFTVAMAEQSSTDDTLDVDENESSCLTDEEHTHTVKHYHKYMSKCTCDATHGKSCNTDDHLKFAFGFAKLNQTQRADAVRAMLFALTAPKSKTNEALRAYAQQERKRRRLTTTSNSSTVYLIQGQRVCHHAFCGIVQFACATINRMGREVANESNVKRIPRLKHSRFGKVTLQTTICLHFLKSYGQRNALACPSGRGSKEDEPVRDLETTGAFRAFGSPFVLKIWRERFQSLRIRRLGTDFCDTCTQLRNQIDVLPPGEMRQLLVEIRSLHREKARQEYNIYMELSDRARTNPGTTEVHVTFDFAEKVLLPVLKRQPGQLHFITGLKFDLFAAASSNLDKVFVYGLPEGFWPHGKTANEVISMVDPVCHRHDGRTTPTHDVEQLSLKCDNCGGLNNNRWVLWYVVFLSITRYQLVTLRFLIPGHTKNRCDGAFGLIKKTVKHRNINCPADMYAAIDDSSHKTTVVEATCVLWRDWKRFLGQFFTLPSTLKMNSFYVFQDRRESPGKLFVKKYSSCPSWTEFSLFKKNVTIGEVCKNADAICKNCMVLPINSLSNVQATKTKTRAQYLTDEICTRFHPGDLTFKDRFFSSGCDWKHSETPFIN